MSLSTFAFVYGSCLYIFPMTTLTTTVTIVSLFSKKLVIPAITKTCQNINENWRHYYLSGTKED